MSVCQDHSKPAFALVALETVLTLVEEEQLLVVRGGSRHGVLVSSSVVDKAILTRTFVKVRGNLIFYVAL